MNKSETKTKLSSLEQWREGLRKDSSRYKEVFGSGSGAVILDQLKTHFIKPRLMADTPEKTAYNVGQHDLAQFIIDLVELRDE